MHIFTQIKRAAVAVDGDRGMMPRRDMPGLTFDGGASPCHHKRAKTGASVGTPVYL